MNNAVLCKNCKHYRYFFYSHYCSFNKKSSKMSCVTGKRNIIYTYCEEMRKNQDECGHKGRYFSPTGWYLIKKFFTYKSNNPTILQ